MSPASVEAFLRTIGSGVVIVGVILALLQLRLNAKQAKARNAYDLIGKVTDPSFPVRRHLLYEVAAKHAGGDWAGFDRSLDDFQVRSFANLYEQLGLLVKKGVIDLEDVMEALSAQPMADWHAFAPIRTHIMEQSAKALPALATSQAGIDSIFWPNFKWLAEQNAKWVRTRSSRS